MDIHYRISLWNYLFYNQPGPLEKVVGEIRDAGYGIELFPRWHGEDNLYAPACRSHLRDLVSDMPSSLHGGGPDTIKQHQLQIETAADTESDVIVVHTNHMKLEGEQPDFTFAQEVLDQAHDRDITIALETGSLPALKRALNHLTGLSICLDTGHVHHHPESLETFFEALKQHLCHLHLEDSLGETEHYVPGSGIIPVADWGNLFVGLQKICYDGAWVLEIRPRKPLQHAEQTKAFFAQILNSFCQ